ncbi:MAG: isoprenyl transferase [Clostridia bacterium]|nr:isoprenyl transferase [Clostridia bacterium]MCI9413337.1 isoprenyl transferase [Clostridia bacterium]
MQITIPKHVAIIMDGNRRWAKERNIETRLGHKEGAETLKKIAKYANKIGIQYLTVYAFSTENWKRTKEEVGALMGLLQMYVNDFLNDKELENIKINVLGDVSKLEHGLQKSIQKAIDRTKDYTGMTLNVAFNYGGRDEITKAVQKIATKVQNNEIAIQDIDEQYVSDNLYTQGQLEPDLLIRTGGEQRVSNFLLWQLAYTEFLFIDKYWPDFSEEDLEKAINVFEQRNRKFGAK